MITRRDFVKKSALTGAVLTMGGITTNFSCGTASEWLSVALADLPVLLQMSLSIASLATTLRGGTISAAEQAAITKISTEAGADITLILSLYNQYKQTPTAGILANIEKAIAELNDSLPALLAAAHISNAVLAARISAAVNLILTTVTSFASLIPQPTNATVAKMKAANTKKWIAKPKDLKTAWNLSVCAPTGNTELDGALGKVAF